MDFINYLKGGDLRSIAAADKVVSLVKTQTNFDDLFQFLFSKDRLIVMRAADSIEKITLRQPDFLRGHTQEIINLMNTAVDKELKWHMAQIVSRINLTIDEFEMVWDKLKKWATDKKESKIVRVNSIQSLFDLMHKNNQKEKDFDLIIQKIKRENIPSINARLKKLALTSIKKKGK